MNIVRFGSMHGSSVNVSVMAWELGLELGLKLLQWLYN